MASRDLKKEKAFRRDVYTSLKDVAQDIVMPHESRPAKRLKSKLALAQVAREYSLEKGRSGGRVAA